MTRFYDLPLSDNDALNGFRYLVGIAKLLSILLGVRELRARRYRAHGAWMARAYGLGAGTQVITNVTWLVISGKPNTTERAWLMIAGWVINAIVVEYSLRQRTFRTKSRLS